MRVDSSRPTPITAPPAAASSSSTPKDSKGVRDQVQPDTKVSKQWGDDIFMDPRKGDKAQSSADKKDGRQVSDANINSNYVEGNEGSRYVDWHKDVAEFKTGTGFSKDGTGAQFEASALETQGDASYMANPLKGVKGQAGAEANLVSLRGDAGVGKDLKEVPGLDKVDGKLYGGVHGEVLVGANADAKGKVAYDVKNGDVGVEGSAGALVGAEASATARGEAGPVQGKVTGGVIAGVGAAVGGKLALEDGKLTIGAKAKGALGVGLGFEGGATIDFKKAGKTVENIVGKDNIQKVTEPVKDVAKDVGNTVKDAGKSVGNFFKGLF